MSRISVQRPALVVFTLGPDHETRRRSLLPERFLRFEKHLHHACLDATLAAGRAARCKLEVASPLELALPPDVTQRTQASGDFGARIEAALEGAFSEHASCVILVGSDTPDLGETHLRDTLDVLEKDPDRVVIGPSSDGGIYLLASSRPLGILLSEIRWRSRHTLKSLIDALRARGRSVFLLSPLADLDQRSDLERWLAASFKGDRASTFWTLHEYQFVLVMARLLTQIKLPHCPRAMFRKLWRVSRAQLLRGPPRLTQLLSV